MQLLPPPGPARTRQLALLGLLLITAAYALSRLGTGSVPAMPPAQTSNTQTAARPAPSGSAAASNAMPQALKLDKLEPVPDSPDAARDPFRFGVKPPPPPPPAPPYVPPPPPRPTAPPQPPVPTIRGVLFIGRVVLPNNRVIATLSDGKGGIFRASEGDIVDGRYRVLKIGEESLLIEFVDGTARTTIPLRGS